MRQTIRTAGAALVLMLAAAVPAAAQSCSVPAAAPAIAADAGARINAQRRGAGLGALGQSGRLMEVARRHACDMAEARRMSHTGRTGGSFGRRIRAVGGCGQAGENIAAGQRSTGQVVASWMRSSGHRRNILMRGATGYGFAVAQPRGGGPAYWVLVVGSRC